MPQSRCLGNNRRDLNAHTHGKACALVARAAPIADRRSSAIQRSTRELLRLVLLIVQILVDVPDAAKLGADAGRELRSRAAPDFFVAG